jgi:hypothetical protein
LGDCLPVDVAEPSSRVDGDTDPAALGCTVPDVTDPEVDAPPVGDETETGSCVDCVGVVEVGVVDVDVVWVGVVWVGVVAVGVAAGGVVVVVVDDGVVDVWVGSMGDSDTVGLGRVVTVVTGPDVGALPEGEEVGVVPVACVGAFDVCVGSVGDETEVGDPDVGVDVGIAP